MVHHYLLRVAVLKGVRVTDQLRLVVDPLLVGLKVLHPTPTAAGTYEIYTLCRHSPIHQSTDEGQRVRSASVYCDVLGLLLPSEQGQVDRLTGKVLVQVGVVNGVHSLHIILVTVVG